MKKKSINQNQNDVDTREIRERKKVSWIDSVFTSVAPNYDLMNDLMSGGMHRLWKSALIQSIKPAPNLTIVDVGGGTGDISFSLLNKISSHVILFDINTTMLSIGKERATEKGKLDKLTWVCGDAEALPLPCGSVDIYITAFCLRNVGRLPEALREARRILKPGGQFLCLEFSTVTLPVLSRLYNSYSFKVLPIVGHLVAKDREAYLYLVESIRKFPAQDKFAHLIREAGLDQVNYRSLSGGIVAIHSAWRL